MRYNRLTLIGRLCADPVEKNTPGGGGYAGFNLAVDDGWGDRKDTYFVHVRVFGKAMETVLRFCRKGTLALFDGKLKQDRWEKDGRKHEKIVMHAFQVELGPKSSNEEGRATRPQREYPEPKAAETKSFLEADETPF